ncbi:MAG: peptidoglycan-binding protein [Treponema sp.]|jgi:hypothetical protein|nr:peptidoglycan-binding protein [Treponema sp.]
MKCDEFGDVLYSDEKPGIRERIGMAFHLLLCGRCALDARRREDMRVLFTERFFPPCPDFSDAIMDRIREEACDMDTVFDIPGGVSTRGWVVVGLAALLSLTSAFFGRDLVNASFLLPLGITVGIIVTVYGAVFIGSHLKELSERFKL